MTLSVNVPFYKVVVLSVGLFDSMIVNERHFPDRDSASAYVQTLDSGLVGVMIEM